jgi:hypothetical protein
LGFVIVVDIEFKVAVIYGIGPRAWVAPEKYEHVVVGRPGRGGKKKVD